MMPPEMETRAGELLSEIAELAVVEPLIWIVPFNNTHVFDESNSGLAPTVNVPLRCRTITLVGLAPRAASYWDCTLEMVVELIVRSARPMPLTIMLVCGSSIRGG